MLDTLRNLLLASECPPQHGKGGEHIDMEIHSSGNEGSDEGGKGVMVDIARGLGVGDWLELMHTVTLDDLRTRRTG